MADEHLGPRIPLAALLILKLRVVSGPTTLLLVQPQSSEAKTLFDVDHPRRADIDDPFDGSSRKE